MRGYRMSEHEADISELSHRIEAADIDLDEAAKEFQQRAAVFFGDWYASEARRLIQVDPYAASNMGAKGVKEMKAAVQALSKKSPSNSASILGGEDVWWHKMRGPGRGNLPGTRAGRWPTIDDWLGDEVPWTISYAMGRLAGLLCFAIVEFGFNDYFHGLTIESTRYKGKVQWSDELVAAFDAYKKKLAEAEALRAQLNETQQGLQQSKAGAMWNDA